MILLISGIALVTTGPIDPSLISTRMSGIARVCIDMDVGAASTAAENVSKMIADRIVERRNLLGTVSANVK
jgi:hypothetical protein